METQERHHVPAPELGKIGARIFPAAGASPRGAPLVHRSLSANPIAAGAPIRGGRPLILDIATSVIAEGKIQLARNKREKVTPGQILDGAGRPTDDPEFFYAKPPGAILPFGGHKGSGLSLFCEIIAGSLTGGFASNPATPTARRPVNNMTSLRFHPALFAGNDFAARAPPLL